MSIKKKKCMVHEMSQKEEGPSGLSLQVTTPSGPCEGVRISGAVQYHNTQKDMQRRSPCEYVSTTEAENIGVKACFPDILAVFTSF